MGWRHSALLFLLTTALATPAAAVDVDPVDYVALKPGTNMLLLYGTYTDRDAIQVPGVGLLGSDTELRSSIGLVRFVHFVKIGPFIADPQIIVPFGAIYSGRAAGQRLRSSSGIGDIMPFATLWLVHHDDPVHGTYVGFSPIVSMPTGTYSHNKAANIGGNRYTYDMQVGVVQGVARRFALEAYGDMTWYGHNDDYGVDRQTLTQHRTDAVQIWGRYTLSPKTSASIGYAGYWGGRQYVDGLYNGTKTENQQVRFAVQTFVAPGLQVEGSAGHMVHVEGGFREAIRAQIRIAKIF